MCGFCQPAPQGACEATWNTGEAGEKDVYALAMTVNGAATMVELKRAGVAQGSSAAAGHCQERFWALSGHFLCNISGSSTAQARRPRALTAVGDRTRP